jgi:hypothetical protein
MELDKQRTRPMELHEVKDWVDGTKCAQTA